MWLLSTWNVASLNWVVLCQLHAGFQRFSTHTKKNIKYLNSFSYWLHDELIIFWYTGLNNTLLKLLKLVSPCFPGLDNILSLTNMLLGLFHSGPSHCLEWAASTLAMLCVPTFYICWTAPCFLHPCAHSCTSMAAFIRGLPLSSYSAQKNYAERITPFPDVERGGSVILVDLDLEV